MSRSERRGSVVWAVAILVWIAAALFAGIRTQAPAAPGSGRTAPPPEPTLRLARDPSRGENLNVLLVTLDTLSPDHLGCYGSERARTPVLDGLAHRGLLFTQGVAPAPLTLPSHTSIMTSLIPPRHGLRINGSGALAPEEETLAELMRAAGYRTAAFVASIVLHERHGVNQGFEVYDDRVHRKGETDPFLVSERPADEVTDAALAWMDGLSGKRNFFAWVHYYDPHAEYDPPPPYDQLFALRPYDGEIAFTDAEFGRLLDGMKARGLWENTLLVVVSDHGESLGEHEEKAHAIFVYDATVWVVFLISHPDARRENLPSSPWRSRVLEEQVRLIDVAPTILELVGLSSLPGAQGTSLAPLVLGTGGPPPPVAYTESLDGFAEFGWARLRGVRAPPWKYIHGAREELYHLIQDPAETVNVAAGEPVEIERLRGELERILEEARGSAPHVVPVALDSESLELLRSVGYVGGSEQPASGSEEADLADDHLRADPTEMIRHYNNLIGPALTLLSDEEPGRAKQLLEELLELDPRNKVALNVLAGCEISLGNLKRARRVLEEVLEVEPEWELPHRVMAAVVHDLGEHDVAIAYLRRSIALMPVNPEAHELLGTFLRGKGDEEGALAEYEASIAQDPGLTRAHFHLAQLREGRGELDQAAASYQAALASEPEHVGSLLNLGSLHARHGPAARAVSLFRRALELSEPAESGGIYVNLGNAYSTLRMYHLAVAAYREALRLDPRDAQSHYALGCSLAFLGEVEEARDEWGRALELDPSHAAARENLERVNP